MASESERLQAIIDELLRVTDGLLSSKVSFETTTEYLLDRTSEMDPVTLQRVACLLVLEVLKVRFED